MNSTTVQKIKTGISWERFGGGILLLLGSVFRIRQYLTGRSLWLDEAMLALNIVNRTFTGLFQPLDYDQGAPIGFLLAEKIFNLLFGEHEFVLRLFPLLAGLASLVLFYLLLRKTTSGFALLTGLGLFAVGPELIYYSSELKQYSVDVAITISLLLLAFPFLERQETKRDTFSLGMAGILALWFSHPALFVLAGIGICLLIQSLKSRERPRLVSIILLGVAWLINLGLLYSVSLRGLSQNPFLLNFWDENFIPVPPWSDWGWFGTVFSGLIREQVGIQVSAWLVFIVVILGLLLLFKKNRSYAWMFLTIFALMLITSGLRLYPFSGRLSLFLVPLLIILISQSIDTLEHQFQATSNWNKLVALAFGLYLLYTPAADSLSNFTEPKYFEHIRPSMAALSENWQAGDVLFVSNGAVPAFRFYADRYGLGSVNYQASAASDYEEPTRILYRLKSLDGKLRVWILITHVYEKDGFNEKDFLLNFLNTIGDEKKEFRSPGTSVYLYLYDLSQ